MDLGDLIRPEGVFVPLRAQGKRQALQELAAKAAQMAKLNPNAVFELLWRRERLSSTGIGRGVAIPHEHVPGLESLMVLVAKLDQPIDFESADGQPVEIIFLLLAPVNSGADRLRAQARIARVMREPQAIEKLRGCRSRSAFYAALTEPLASNAA